MSVALGGNLQDFGIAEVFQLIGQQRKTGVLEITGAKDTMRLAFDSGAVVFASPVGASDYSVLGEQLVRSGLITQSRLDSLVEESENSARPLPVMLIATGAISQADLDQTQELLTRETIFEVLRWTHGSFHFSAQPIRHSRPADTLLAAEQILMDGLRMMDEWRTFADRLSDEDAVFQRVAGMEVHRQRAQGDGRNRVVHAERVYQLVDGRLTIRRIIDLSRLGTFEATRVLVDLMDTGIIQRVDSGTPRAGTSEPRLRPVAQQVGSALAAALPLAVLSLMVSLSYGMLLPAAERVSSFPINRHPLAEARQSFEKRRLSYAIHAERFLEGDWPASLDELRAVSLTHKDALADSSAEPYYYSQSETGIMLLAPDR